MTCIFGSTWWQNDQFYLDLNFESIFLIIRFEPSKRHFLSNQKPVMFVPWHLVPDPTHPPSEGHVSLKGYTYVTFLSASNPLQKGRTNWAMKKHPCCNYIRFCWIPARERQDPYDITGKDFPIFHPSTQPISTNQKSSTNQNHQPINKSTTTTTIHHNNNNNNNNNNQMALCFLTTTTHHNVLKNAHTEILRSFLPGINDHTERP